jgi:tRNA(Met) C34 N-acetyltransferase TmcA
MPPLLQRLSERKPEQLDYLGVSFGLTKDLLRFWKRAGYTPLFASQRENDLTGEHSFVMLRALLSNTAQAESWLSAFAQGELQSCLLRSPADGQISDNDSCPYSHTIHSRNSIHPHHFQSLMRHPLVH